jgi:hypothetical protein
MDWPMGALRWLVVGLGDGRDPRQVLRSRPDTSPDALTHSFPNAFSDASSDAFSDTSPGSYVHAYEWLYYFQRLWVRT